VRHLLTVDPHAPLRRAATIMSDRGVGCAVVMELEKVAGIITERDLLHAIAKGDDIDAKTVAEAMTRDVVSGTPGWDIVRAVKTMTEGGFRHLLVMEVNDPVGIVSLRDLMSSMVDLLEARPASGA
jgi:CBS domain-containing protein